MSPSLSNIHVACGSGYFGLRSRFGNEHSLLGFYSNFILATLFGTLLAISRKYHVLGFLGLVLIVFFLVEYGVRTTPREKLDMDHTSSIKILSHNTGQDLPGYQLRHDLIISSNADIVFLQEITQEFLEDHLQQLKEIYPHQAIGPLQEDRDQLVGMAILSKYPLLEVTNFKLADEGLVFQQRAVIDLNGTKIVGYNIHTTFPWMRFRKDLIFNKIPVPIYDNKVRGEEIARLVNLIEQEQDPVLLAGDFNLTHQSSEYNLLTNSNLVDSYDAVGNGLGFTWPANRTPSVNIRPAIPFVRVDYIFGSPHFIAISAEVLSKTGSDHKPLTATFQLNKAEQS